jgi:orotate phosphoribosyltransferase
MAEPTDATMGQEFSAETARILLDAGAVHFKFDRPFKFTSGWASPVYIDCRKLISFPEMRRKVMDFAVTTLERDIGAGNFDAVAGGETAGIPFAAWIAERMELPMLYVRKSPKGFGRNAQIEGHLIEGQRVLLVDDLATDGRSKVNFCKALRDAGATVEDIFVLFYYGIFKEGREVFDNIGVRLHALATWSDILTAAKVSSKFDKSTLAEVETFIDDPVAWSKAHGGVAEERMLAQPFAGQPKGA